MKPWKIPGIVIEVMEFYEELGSNFSDPSFNLTVEKTVLFS